MDFVHLWSFIASLARFCVIKSFKAAQFVNAMGIVGAERLSNLSGQLKVMNGPHAVLVVDGPDHRPETGRTQFPALTLNFTAIRQAVPLGSTHWDYKHRAGRPNKKSSPHPEYARHAGASCEICRGRCSATSARSRVQAYDNVGLAWKGSARGKRWCHNKLAD